LKRTKRRILTSIIAAKDEYELALGASIDAYRYNDETHIIQVGRDTPTAEFYALTGYTCSIRAAMDNHNLRGMAYRSIWPGSDYPDDIVVMFMEVGWRVSDPDAVRTSIEYNPDKIITATRYFQWDDDHYRVDGPYRPARIPIAAKAKQGIHWSSPVQTAPDWMWSSRNLWVDGGFDIIDVTFTYPGYKWADGQPDLQPIEGRVFA
jgi:hypothetical protein